MLLMLHGLHNKPHNQHTVWQLTLAQFLRHESDHILSWMHNKQMVINENKFRSLLWTHVSKPMDVVLKEEIPTSKGQGSVEQGQ